MSDWMRWRVHEEGADMGEGIGVVGVDWMV